MNKDKAIQLLERLQDPEPYEPMLTKDAYDAIQMAIDALSADGDTISREAAIEVIDSFNVFESRSDQIKLEQMIGELPPAQPDVPDINVGDMISRQAAIDAFLTELTKRERKNLLHTWSTVEVKYFITKMLEQMPSAQPEPCEDAVSRKDCLQALSHLMDVEGFRSGWAVSRANVECMLKAMPSVTPKQRTGKWIDGIIPNDSDGLPVIVCDQCNTFFPLQFGDGHNFCPNCGAKMVEGVGE